MNLAHFGTSTRWARIGVAALVTIAILATFSIARASSVKWLYPPVGTWSSYASWSEPASDCGFNWSLKFVTQTYRASASADQTRIDYVSLYDGWANTSLPSHGNGTGC